MKKLNYIYNPFKLLLLAVCLLVSIQGWAQLYVKENAELTVKSSLSSKQTNNIFESSVSGDGILEFTDSEIQNLISSNLISTPGINISRVNTFNIFSQISITDDLNLADAKLNVFDHLYVKGKLMTSAQVDITGKHLIYQSTDFKDQSPIALTKNKQHTLPVLLTNTVLNTNFQISLKKKITHYKDITFNELNPQPITPPPKKIIF